ncbi:KAP family NTPase [Mesorhizobium sp. BR115XR7A]|uniref:KAP family P-loop NTPase fold protein n=1 Tax=Mesorhizobium sp. BR115XR7A TaxID=2876645 RepID=UPI001CC93B1E|nr:P-loop NTPase fold protein [Mesorhizobium sp. BR115XR7A]MBZ9907180.1 KAP family NTPase [Mesorhizobium sp. BR115XR7A]MBZ9931303.1 KAP family NTPase [Mesorhizobium sp. BR1-1-5]
MNAVKQEADEVWKDDKIGRKNDARFIIDFLVQSVGLRKRLGKTASYVLNIDSEWGSGKSFFVSRLARQLRIEGYLVAEVNSWRDDHSEDPLVAIMAEIDKVMKPHTAKKAIVKKVWNDVKSNGAQIAGRTLVALGKSAIRRYTNSTIDDLLHGEDAGHVVPAENSKSDVGVLDDAIVAAGKEIEALTDKTADALIAEFAKASQSIQSFRSNMGELTSKLPEIGLRCPLFVIIDELDRCRPSYAVAMLERVKHLFEANEVVFVFSTDTGQLQHAIRGAYGGDFDGRGYLSRFFDRRYSFAEPRLGEFVASKLDLIDLTKLSSPAQSGLLEPKDILKNVITNGFAAQNPIPLRAIEQIMDIMGSTTAAWRYPEKIDLPSLLILASCYHRKQNFDYSAFVTTMASWNADAVWAQTRESINVVQIALTVMSRAQNIRTALLDTPQSAADSYVDSVFAEEYKRRSKAGGSAPASVQAELQGLIRNAGRITRGRT